LFILEQQVLLQEPKQEDQAYKGHMDLIEKKKFQLENLEKNLAQLQESLAPMLNKVELMKRTIGTPQTKHELEIGNLLFSGDSVLIWYKQCFSQMNSRLEGALDSFFNLQKLKIKIDKLSAKNSLTKLEEVKLLKHQTDYVKLEGYVQNAISEISHYNNAAIRMKETFNIPDEITDDDMDRASIEDHIKTAFKQAVQDVSQHGVITRGTFGHLEQWGIHPMTAKFYVFNYIKSCDELLQQGKTPNVKHLHNFLEEMYQIHKDLYKDNKTRLGI